MDKGFNLDHPEFAGQINGSLDASTGNNDDMTGSTDRETNHGTTVTGLLIGRANNNNLAAGIVPDSRAYLCKVTSTTSTVQWIDALEFFMDNDVHVVSASVRWDIDPTANRQSAADQQFFNLIFNHNIIWCQSTTNCQNDCSINWTSSNYPIVLQSTNPTDFSNAFFNVAGVNTTVDFEGDFAFQKILGITGPEINISYPAKRNLVYHFQHYNYHAHASGTSWATPSVAGIVALARSALLQGTGHPGQVRDIINAIEHTAFREPTYTARNTSGSGLNFTNNYNEAYGFGIPNASAAIAFIISNYFDKVPIAFGNLIGAKDRSFYMDGMEVNQFTYFDVMGTNPSILSGDLNPVENITFYDALLFSNALSRQYGLEPVYMFTNAANQEDPCNSGNPGDGCDYTGEISISEESNGYRLPILDEWEYAHKANSETFYYWGDMFDDSYLWYSDNSSGTTQTIGTKSPNSFQLYDMIGNVEEWVLENNLTGTRALGGCYLDYETDINSNITNHGRSIEENYRDYYLGFRVVRNWKRSIVPSIVTPLF